MGGGGDDHGDEYDILVVGGVTFLRSNVDKANNVVENNKFKVRYI